MNIVCKKVFIHTPDVDEVVKAIKANGIYSFKAFQWNNRSTLVSFYDEEEYLVFVLRGLKEKIHLDALERYSYNDFLNTIILNKKLNIKDI